MLVKHKRVAVHFVRYIPPSHSSMYISIKDCASVDQEMTRLVTQVSKKLMLKLPSSPLTTLNTESRRRLMGGGGGGGGEGWEGGLMEL